MAVGPKHSPPTAPKFGVQGSNPTPQRERDFSMNLAFNRTAPRAFCVALTLCLVTTSELASAEPVRLVANGKLIGATGVDVGGRLYDVAFVEGSCFEIFAGCDSVADLDFTTAGDASTAVEALLTQVLLDTPLGNFDTQPDLTFGCEGVSTCFVTIPLNLFFPPQAPTTIVAAVAAANTVGTDAFTQSILLAATQSTASMPGFVYANFTAADPNVVPEPGSLVLLGTGGLVLLTKLRRRRRGHRTPDTSEKR